MRRIWFHALLALLIAGSVRAQWDVTKIDGRDYVTLGAIAKFYGMSAPQSIGAGRFACEGGGRSFRVRVARRDAIIDGARHWLAFPPIARDGQVYISRADVSHTIDVAFRPGSAAGIRPVRTVVLDAGHGGHDKGAISRFGTEKEFTLDMVARVRKRLEKAGFKVVQTRSSDSFVPLESRPAVANRYPDSIFVSIHFNAAGWKPSANGMEIFALPARGTPPTGQKLPQTRDLTTESGHANGAANLVLANTIFHSMLGGMKMYDRGVKRARFSVLKNARVPAVLIEGGFLTNPSEAARISATAWREGFADAITRGIVEYQKLATAKTSPRTVTQYGGKPTTDFIPDE